MMVDPVYPSVLGVHFPLFDLAVLSNCDDVIFDYGTFGFWGAFLAGGVTVLAEDINGRGEPVCIQKAAGHE